MGGEVFAVIRGKEAEQLLRQLGYIDEPQRKYGNKKVVLDGIKFDSKREAERYLILRCSRGWAR